MLSGSRVGETLKAPMGVHVSRASEKTHEAGQMRLSVHVCRCPSKDMHLRGGGSQEPGALAGGPGRAGGLRQLTEPTLLSSLQDTEIINTAILTGRTVAIPVKVIAIEVTGLVLDVSALVECESDNEDIIKVGFLEVGALGERPQTFRGRRTPIQTGIHISDRFPW